MKLIAFDLDGTLIDSLRDITEGLNYALTQAGLPAYTVEQTREIVGHSVGYMIEHAASGRPDLPWQSLLPDYNEFYREHCADHTRPYPGIPEALEELRGAGYTLAIVSNKPDEHSQRIVRVLFRDGLFSFTLGRTDRFATKPDPEPLRYCMDTLGASEVNTVYVGDSEVDVTFARNTGLPMVIVDWGNRTREELETFGAENVVSSVPEMVRAIRSVLPPEETI